MANTNSQQYPADYLTTDEAAQILRRSRRTLERWRATGEFALPFIKLGGGQILYKRQDLFEFLDAHRITSTAEYEV